MTSTSLDPAYDLLDRHPGVALVVRLDNQLDIVKELSLTDILSKAVKTGERVARYSGTAPTMG